MGLFIISGILVVIVGIITVLIIEDIKKQKPL